MNNTYYIEKKRNFFNYGIIRMMRMQPPDNICQCARRLFAAYGLIVLAVATILSTLVVGTLFLAGFSPATMMTGFNPVSLFLALGIFGSGAVMFAGAVAALLAGMLVYGGFLYVTEESVGYLKAKVSDKAAKRRAEEGPNLLVEWFKAKKNRVCKQIRWS
jgi:hypothetical protein